MSTIAQLLQAGQPDLELAACKPKVLLAPFFGTSPVLNIEDASTGGLDAAKVGYGTSPFVTVGHHEKKAGVKLSNKPTANRIMSGGAGSPTRILFSESGKGIVYTPQEVNFWNLQNSWGFTPDAVSAPSAHGGITIAIPSLPARTLWRAILIAGDTFNGKPIYLFWIANRAEVGDRQDVNAVDSNVYEHGVALEFQDDEAVGEDQQVIFGICGEGWQDLSNTARTGLVGGGKNFVVTLGSPSAGNFTLTWRGKTTANIAYNAANSAVKAALVALDDGYGTSDWTVAGSAGGPYTVTTPSWGPLTGDGTGLTSGTFSVAAA
jgi:hypothetical protein